MCTISLPRSHRAGQFVRNRLVLIPGSTLRLAVQLERRGHLGAAAGVEFGAGKGATENAVHAQNN